MPHIDDGTLHAWLDGAIDALAAAGALPDGMQPGDVATHLEQCADCRARLERERDVRERAGIVLHDVGPSRIHTPPLAAAPHVAPRRRAWLPMAWAASLLMAVGAGWWGSQIARDPRVASQSVSDTEQELQAMDRIPEDRAEPSIDVPAPIARPAAAAAAESLTSGDASSLRTRGAIDVAGATASIEEHRLDTTRSSPDRVARAERAGLPAAESAGTDLARRAPLGRVADAETVAQAPPPAAPQMLRAPRRSLGANVQEVAPPRPLAANVQEIAPWSAVTFEGISGFIERDTSGLLHWTPLGASSAMGIADAEILSAERASEIGADVTRVTQRLGTGDTIEVLSWTEQSISLQELVVTGIRSDAQAPRAPVQSRAPAAEKSSDAARMDVRLVRARSTGSRAQELLFTRPNGWVLVRAPSWLDADEVRARLGAVSVAPVAR